MYPRLKLEYENYTTGDKIIFSKGKELLKQLKKLDNKTIYKVEFKFQNYRPNEDKIEMTFKETGFKITTIAETLIKKIEEKSKFQ